MRFWWLGAGLLLAPGAVAATPGVAASSRYVCDDGSLAVIDVRNDGPVLTRGGMVTRLAPGAVFSGFRFLAQGLELRGRGDVDDRRLTIRAAGAPALACKSVPPMAMPGVATGTISFAGAARLPPGAVVTVELRDTVRADARARLLARAELRPRANRAPLHWRLEYDARAGAYPMRLSLSARIRDAAGRLIWISDTFTPVAVSAGTAHAEAEIRVVPAQR